MMCPIFLLLILSNQIFTKAREALQIKELFVALLDRNGNSNSHADHGVVTCADETHHLYASVN